MVPKMPILVSTKKGLGSRSDNLKDFSFVPEGEIVTFPVDFDTRELPISLIGLHKRKATTSFMCSEQKMTPDEVRAEILKSLKNGGWDKIVSPGELINEAEAEFNSIAETCSKMPINVPLERNKQGKFKTRKTR